MKVCVIPARGGSKRIPRKNTKLFAGKPIIEYSIEAALNSECFDKVIVSTDDKEIANISTAAGADVPFERPAKLADDFSGTSAVVAHAIEWFRENVKAPEYVCCLYATAPFVRAEDIKSGQLVLHETESDFAFSVTSYSFPIQRAVRITENNRVEMFSPEHLKSRSQDLEEAYHDAGQFYWGKASAWMSERPIFSHEASPVIIPRYRVQDIDTAEDWQRAELMYKVLELEGLV